MLVRRARDPITRHLEYSFKRNRAVELSLHHARQRTEYLAAWFRLLGMHRTRVRERACAPAPRWGVRAAAAGFRIITG